MHQRRIRQRLKSLLAAGLALLAAAHTPIAAASQGTIFRIATASKAGTFYPVGSIIAQGISEAPDCAGGARCGVTGLIAIAQVSNGSVANVESISARAIEAALGQADVIYWAHTGTGRFAGRGPLEGLRAVANLFPGSLHVVTRRDQGISDIEGLRGRRVALDEPGSGTLATAELILSSVRISKDDLSALYIKHNHAGPMLANGEIDAFFFVAGYPTRSVLDVAKTSPIALLSLSPDTVDALIAQRPYFTPGTIPAGAYPGLDRAVNTVDIGTQLIVHADLDAELVYRITAALWNERTRRLLDEGHPKGAQVRRETALRGIAITLHPGAERYYREVGMLR